MSALRNLPLFVDDPVARCARRRPHFAPPRPRDADIAMVGHRQSSIAAPNLRIPISRKRKRRRRPAAAAPPSPRQQVAQVDRHATGLPPLALSRARERTANRVNGERGSGCAQQPPRSRSDPVARHRGPSAQQREVHPCRSPAPTSIREKKLSPAAHSYYYCRRRVPLPHHVNG